MGISHRFSFWLWKAIFFNRIRTFLGWEHVCAYTLVDTVIYRTEKRAGGIPLVAWVYRCWCGREIVEITESGVDLLMQGVPYAAIVGREPYVANRISEGYEERHGKPADEQE